MARRSVPIDPLYRRCTVCYEPVYRRRPRPARLLPDQAPGPLLNPDGTTHACTPAPAASRVLECSCGFYVAQAPDGTKTLWPGGAVHAAHPERPDVHSVRLEAQLRAWDRFYAAEGKAGGQVSPYAERDGLWGTDVKAPVTPQDAQQTAEGVDPGSVPAGADSLRFTAPTGPTEDQPGTVRPEPGPASHGPERPRGGGIL